MNSELSKFKIGLKSCCCNLHFTLSLPLTPTLPPESEALFLSFWKQILLAECSSHGVFGVFEVEGLNRIGATQREIGREKLHKMEFGAFGAKRLCVIPQLSIRFHKRITPVQGYTPLFLPALYALILHLIKQRDRVTNSLQENMAGRQCMFYKSRKRPCVSMTFNKDGINILEI